jgi:hypothetical protein
MEEEEHTFATIAQGSGKRGTNLHLVAAHQQRCGKVHRAITKPDLPWPGCRRPRTPFPMRAGRGRGRG